MTKQAEQRQQRQFLLDHDIRAGVPCRCMWPECEENALQAIDGVCLCAGHLRRQEALAVEKEALRVERLSRESPGVLIPK